jgi:hypothetical protein
METVLAAVVEVHEVGMETELTAGVLALAVVDEAAKGGGALQVSYQLQ